MQTEYRRILADKAELERITKDGARRASEAAEKTLDLVYRRVGLRCSYRRNRPPEGRP